MYNWKPAKLVCKARHLAFVTLFVSGALPNNAFAQGGGMGDYGAYSSGGFAGGIFVEAICDIMGLVTGDFGGLLTAVAFLGALIVAATNNFRGIAAGIIVAVGCFSVASWLSFGFGQFSCQ